jgi:hypothetical protein
LAASEWPRESELMKRWRNTPSIPYASIQAKWRTTVGRRYELKTSAGEPSACTKPVGKRSAAGNSERSGHMSTRTFPGAGLAPPRAQWL